MNFFPWQMDSTRELCSFDRHRQRWSYPEFAVIADRQNGKSEILEARIAGGLFLWGERSILYTSHQFEATVTIFDRLVDRIDNTRILSRRVRRVYQGNNSKKIILKSGAQAVFKCRTKVAGRAMTADTIFLDEALFLDPAQVGSLMPLMAARSKHGNTQVIYASSAGKVTSKVLADIRARALTADPGDKLGYLEWSIPGWHELNDDERATWGNIEAYYGNPETHRLSNPSYNLLISPDYLNQMFHSMRKTSLQEFAREYLGVFDQPTLRLAAIDRETWDKLVDSAPNAPGTPIVAAVDMPPSRDSATIVFAWPFADGRIYTEVVDRREGTSWVPSRLAELVHRWKPDQVLLKADGPAGQLIPAIAQAGIRLTHPSLTTYAASCGDFLTRTLTGQIVHCGQEELATAVTGLAQRTFRDGEVFTWTRVDPLVDISPAIAATMAVAAVAGIRPHEPVIIRRLS